MLTSALRKWNRPQPLQKGLVSEVFRFWFDLEDVASAIPPQQKSLL